MIKGLDRRLSFMIDVGWEVMYAIHRFGESGEIKFSNKVDGSSVTNVDHTIDAMWRLAVEKDYPSYGFLSEEGADDLSRSDKSKVYIVDPVDGTRHLGSSEGGVTHMAAYVENGRPVFGTIVDPESGTLYAATPDHAFIVVGYSLRGIRRTPDISWGELRVAHPSSYKGSKYTKEVFPRLGLSDENIVNGRGFGARALMLAHQNANAIIGYSKSLGEWDVVAAEALLKPLGYAVFDIHGQELQYNKPADHPKMDSGIVIVPENLKDETLERLVTVRENVPL